MRSDNHTKTRTTEPVRRIPMATLKARLFGSDRSMRLIAAPDTNQAPQDGTAAAMNSVANIAACANGLPESELRNVPAALTATIHDFGFIHCRSVAEPNPTGLWSPTSGEGGAVAIFHASQRSNVAPPSFMMNNNVGCSRSSVPRPRATAPRSVPVPTATPRRQGTPRMTPTCAPVAATSTLAGPGVPAATAENAR